MVKIETTQTKNQTMGIYDTSTTEVVLPPYSKRAFVAIILVIPVAFGINIPLNSMVFFILTILLHLFSLIYLQFHQTLVLLLQTIVKQNMLHHTFYPPL